MISSREGFFVLTTAVGSKQLPKLLVRQPGIANESAHRNRIDRIVSGNREKAGAIAHHDVFPLAGES
jgi:hypothetical protein